MLLKVLKTEHSVGLLVITFSFLNLILGIGHSLCGSDFKKEMPIFGELKQQQQQKYKVILVRRQNTTKMQILFMIFTELGKNESESAQNIFC